MGLLFINKCAVVTHGAVPFFDTEIRDLHCMSQLINT